jgi:opacity protein-like surface antigen
MRMSKIAVLAVVLVLAASFAAVAADVTGQWTTQFDTQVGVQKYTFDFKVNGEALTGTAAFERMGEKGTAELKEGKVQGDKVTFVEMLDFQGNAIRIEYTGTIAGDEIKFTRKVGDFATEELVAKRAK